ncbi:MAG: helix-turn-helix domain-containing protein, partial [Bacillota bacterium]|nr:helix-turn-helix domain-containing protein [Bacillota bacterium]
MKIERVNHEKVCKIMLNTQIIADEIEDSGWNYTLRVSNGTPNLRYFKVYDSNAPLYKDVLYFVPASNAETFDADGYSYVTCSNLDGKAPHISDIDADEFSILNKMMFIFQKYRDYEIELDNAVIENASLDNLCKIASRIFGNPCYIHDRNFSILGISEQVEGMLNFEKSERDGSLHIPLWLVDQFKFDSDYKQTLERTTASIWGKDQYPHNIRSLYVNIHEGDYYYGRFLINEIHTTLKPGQFRIAEFFANYIRIIATRDEFYESNKSTRYEESIKALASGSDNYSHEDITTFLKIRNWDSNDEYICLIFQTQDEQLSIRSESSLRNILLTEFKESVDFIWNQKLCMIINMTKLGEKLTTVRNTLAQLVRDSYMYCGISNRINGFLNISIGFMQSEVTLEYVKRHSQKWLQIFVDIALEYILDSVNVGIDTQCLISPHLELLVNYDKNHDTEYYKTLKSYLVNERDIPKTSKDLVIHRTTLTHRLEQMKKVTAIDLDNEDMRLYLLISIRLYEKS